jgi:uncharacterized protein
MLHAQIKENLKKAMLFRDEAGLRTLRGLLAAFTNELVAKKRKPSEELDDEDANIVIKRAVKQRKESIEQFRAGKREDLAKIEEEELAILEPMLPQTAGKDEIRKIALKKKEELGITDKSKLGVLMGATIKELKEMKITADGADVKAVAEELFS